MDEKHCGLVGAILKEIEFIERSAQGVTGDDFKGDEEKQHALVMALLNIGELANRLDGDFQEEHEEVPWRQIVGLRNVAAHGYFNLNMDTVWKTIKEDIPELRECLEQL